MRGRTNRTAITADSPVFIRSVIKGTSPGAKLLSLRSLRM